MCGIAGFIQTDLPEDEKKRLLGLMCDAIGHRGPDDHGSYVDHSVALGHRRLSIIDMSGGHQPFAGGDGILQLVYNGEIYNYRELRCSMQRQGITFHTSSDTEVLLKLYEMKGVGAIQEMDGMFAFAVWNKSSRRLCLVRDRIGIKPLYYYWDGHFFAFASELKAILQLPNVERIVNKQAVWDYLSFRYVPGPETAWKNIYKLQPGHFLEFSQSDSGMQLQKYWQQPLPKPESYEQLVCENINAQFETLFMDSVKQRLEAADTPVGVLLSGGLDSSAITAAAVELGHENFHTFSVDFGEKGEYSEFAFAETMARHIGSRHHKVTIGRDDFFALLPEAVGQTDEPLADMASVPLLAVSKLAQKHVKVVLSGEGADEVLGGYDFDSRRRAFVVCAFLRRMPTPMRKLILALAKKRFNTAEQAKFEYLLNRGETGYNHQFHVHMTRVWEQGQKHELWPGFTGDDSDRFLNLEYEKLAHLDPLQALMLVYQQSWLVEDLLMKADKMSMAASLELRVPFLDHKLVAWANALPIECKVQHHGCLRFSSKSLLRRFAERRIPEAILKRPKQGFPVPVYSWLQGDLSHWVDELLLGNDSRLRDSIHPQLMRHTLEQSAGGDSKAAHQIWILIILELWLREWSAHLE